MDTIKSCAICNHSPAPYWHLLPDTFSAEAGHVCTRCFATLETAAQTEEDDPDGTTDAWKEAHAAVAVLGLPRVFRALRKAGVYARASYSCCGRCGAVEALAVMEEQPTKYRGFAFYTKQDNPVEDGGVHLKYGAADDAGTLAVGNQVRDALVDAGFTVEWNGDINECLWVVLA